MKKTQLAEALNITTRQLRSLASRGMPTDSLEAAQRWRSKNLDITQCRGFRIDGNPGKRKRQDKKQEAKKAEAEVDRKAEVGLSDDPYDNFLPKLLQDSMVPICGSLIGEMGMTYTDASIAFNTMCCYIADTREKEGFKSGSWDVPSPADILMPEDWRTKVRAEIEQKAQELALLCRES